MKDQENEEEMEAEEELESQNWKEWREQWGDPPPVGAVPRRRDPAEPVGP